MYDFRIVYSFASFPCDFDHRACEYSAFANGWVPLDITYYCFRCVRACVRVYFLARWMDGWLDGSNGACSQLRILNFAITKITVSNTTQSVEAHELKCCCSCLVFVSIHIHSIFPLFRCSMGLERTNGWKKCKQKQFEPDEETTSDSDSNSGNINS